jgi:hypothetical protein
MTTGTPQRSVLLIGASQRILDDSVAGLRDLGYTAQATSDQRLLQRHHQPVRCRPHRPSRSRWSSGASIIPPGPKSDSLVLLDDRLASGDHTIPVPGHIPPRP